jgi:hypothetical protein
LTDAVIALLAARHRIAGKFSRWADVRDLDVLAALERESAMREPKTQASAVAIG